MSAGPICWWRRRARGYRHVAVAAEGAGRRGIACGTAAGRLPLPGPPGSAPAAARADRRRPGARLAVRTGPLLVCLSTQGAVGSRSSCRWLFAQDPTGPAHSSQGWQGRGVARVAGRQNVGRGSAAARARLLPSWQRRRPGPPIAVVATPPTRGDARGKCWNAVHPASQLLTIRCLGCRLQCQSPARRHRCLTQVPCRCARRDGKLAVAPSHNERSRSMRLSASAKSQI